MITVDFTKRARARLVETRAILTRFNAAYKEATKQLVKLAKNGSDDRDQTYKVLNALAEDLVDKLPDEAEEEDRDKAYELQEKIQDFATDLEALDMAQDEITELSSDSTSDPIHQVFEKLRETDKELAVLEARAKKMKI